MTAWAAAARTRARLNARLCDALAEHGYLEGRLSTSALSTATAVVALAQVDATAHRDLIDGGLRWLTAHAGADGGWGDTVQSFSNLSTTALCKAALVSTPTDIPGVDAAVAGADAWLARAAGGTSPRHLADAVMARYAQDHTFSVPILTLLAICGCLGEDGWHRVRPLPFELAAAPRRLYHLMRLPVVSYALPALIAIGQVVHHTRGTRNPLTRLLRRLTAARTLRILDGLQPENGGFLEAIPLTAFVTMSLAHMGLRTHPVVQRGVAFLQARVREDGSWPIDTHLATWATTLAVNALGDHLPPETRDAVARHLTAQQYTEVHPFTGAAPGGWAWTHLPGGVPDADDTSGALLALARLAPEATADAARAGLRWLLDLQNGDGGMPTFCKGWGTLPFDKSCADITAHALAALWTWRAAGVTLPGTDRAVRRMLRFLARGQRADGSWLPLWFGNQHHPQAHNPVYGTARVLLALQQTRGRTPQEAAAVAPMIAAARHFLVTQAGAQGGWGGAAGLPESIEETALAVQALCAHDALTPEERSAVERGVARLVALTDEGRQATPAPIGFYFANLWYDEAAYPWVFAAGALNEAAAHMPLSPHPSDP